MHDGTIADGDGWLSNNLPAILSSSEYTSGSTAIFIPWDEGTGGKTGEDCATNTTDPSCQVATIVISPSTPVGSTSATLFNHYSLLGTVAGARQQGPPRQTSPPRNCPGSCAS